MDKEQYRKAALYLKGSYNAMVKADKYNDGVNIGNLSIAYLTLLGDPTIEMISQHAMDTHNKEGAVLKDVYTAYKETMEILRKYCEGKAAENE